MIKNIYISIFLLFCVCTYAQEPLRYTTKQGLPTNHVYDLVEDTNGFMWFATKQGVVKYNGEIFKTFTVKEGLPNNDTWLLDTDLQGRVWFFSKSIYQGYIKNDSIYTFSTKDKKVLSPISTYKSKDSLWFFTNNGLHTLNKNNSIDTQPLFFNESNFYATYNKLHQRSGFKSINLKTITIMLNPEAKECLFILKNKILIYDYDFNLKKEIEVNLHHLPNDIKVYRSGSLYNHIGYIFFKEGILFIDFKTYTPYYFSFKELFNVEKSEVKKVINFNHEIQLSIPGHLIVFDEQLNKTHSYAFPTHLSIKSFKDSKGNIWLTDLAHGISLITNTQNQTTYYLKNQKVQKINEIEGKLFAGIQNKGFYEYSNLRKKFENKFSLNDEYHNTYQIKKDKQSQLNYFITGLHYLVYKNNKFEIRNSPLSPKDIIFFNNQLYYVAVNGVNISSLNGEDFKNIIHKEGLLLIENFKNNLYVAGSDGVHQIKNDSLIKPYANNTWVNMPVSSVTATQDYLLVGTDGRGVYALNNNEIIPLSSTDGLSVQKIIKRENKLWLATQKGVFKVQLDDKNLKNSKIIDAFFEADGLLQNNTNDIFIKDSLLYVASDIGLARLNLNSNIYKQQPQLYFKTNKDTLQFKNKERDNISISFAALDFVNQDYLKYEYRLSPKHKKWTSTSTKTLNFTNLPPDFYTVEVRVNNQHNQQSTAKLYIEILPKWWQTIWAKIIFGLLFLLGFFLLLFVIIRRIRKKEEAKSLQEKRVAGLELQALRSQMNPHFVHNSLNAIQYFIQRNEVELSENYLSKFSQLIRLFFEYSRRQTNTIEEEIELLTYYLDIEKLRFEEKLNYTITICKSIDKEEQVIPSMLLQPIVENAVNHGLFHKKEKGLINITFKKIDEETFKVIVEDDGIGINKSKSIFRASSKNYQSHSSAILQERLELLNQSEEWKIVYEIQDKSDIDSSTSGTLVTLRFTKNQLK